MNEQEYKSLKKKIADWISYAKFSSESPEWHADRILSIRVGNRLTLKELIETAEKAQKPIEAVINRARQRPPLILTDD